MTSDLLQPPMPDRSRRVEQERVPPVATRLVSFVLATMLRVVMSFFLGAFKRSDVYAEAIGIAKSNAEVRRELGEPIQEGWWVSGSMKVAGSSGAARFATTLRGSLGVGVLCIQARKHSGEWQFDLLEVAVQGRSERIDLLGRSTHGRRCLTSA